MSNQQTYVRTLFDDASFQLEGAVQAGAKWPPTLAVKPYVNEYKGYTKSYARLTVRTSIEGDRNNGIIEGLVPIKTWQAIGYILESLKGEDVKIDPIECYDRPFGKDKRPSKEDVLMARIHITVREGRISIAVIDARNDARVKIPFYFNTPNSRTPKTVQGQKDDFSLNKAYALAWHKNISSIIYPALKEMQDKAVGRSTTANKPKDSDRNDYDAGGSDSSELDDELPF